MSIAGFSLGCAFSVKWVGLFVIALIGLRTVRDLWDLLGDLRNTKVGNVQAVVLLCSHCFNGILKISQVNLPFFHLTVNDYNMYVLNYGLSTVDYVQELH